MDIDLTKYSEFVAGVTSEISNNPELLSKRINELSQHVNPALALTAAIGMAGEAGEFAEIWKKTIFHNKAFTDETVTHCKKELGDIIFYWMNACRALELDPSAVIEENVNKLLARYPGGKFDPEKSNNRKPGDI